MNTSYSKIRHIRESNILLENRRNRSLITEETTSKSFGNLQTIISQSDQDKKTVPFCKKATPKQLCVVSNESGNPMGWVHERQQWNKILNKYGYSSVEGTGYSYATDKNSPGPYSTGQIWNLDTNQPQGNKPAQKVAQPQDSQPTTEVIRKVPVYNDDRSKLKRYVNLLKIEEWLDPQGNPTLNIRYKVDGNDEQGYFKFYTCGGGGIMCEKRNCMSGEKHTFDTETTNWIESTYCKTTPGQPQNNQPVQKVNQPVQKVNQPVQNVVQPQNNKPAPNVTQPSKPAQRLPSF